MELNKRKSLLTPASPTVWGMIHGDISKQQDLVDVITEKLEEIASSGLANKIKGDILAEITPLLDEALSLKQPKLESGVNIKTLKGRSIMGEGDLDPLDTTDRQTLENIEYDTQLALQRSDYAKNRSNEANTRVTELQTYVDEQIGGIDTMTDDILA